MCHACVRARARLASTASIRHTVYSTTGSVACIDRSAGAWCRGPGWSVATFACIRGRRRPCRAPPARGAQRNESHGEKAQETARGGPWPSSRARGRRRLRVAGRERPGHHVRRLPLPARARARLTWPLRAPCATRGQSVTTHSTYPTMHVPAPCSPRAASTYSMQ